MKKGLTLIEVLIVMALVSIMVAVGVAVFLTALNVWIPGLNRTDVKEGSGLAMETMVRDLSQASTITAAGTDNITFASDVDGDSTDETVTFALDAVNNKLNRTVDGNTTVLAPNVQAFTLTYCRAETETAFTPGSQADRDDIRIITISLSLSNAGETAALSSSVYARNQGI